MSRILHLIGLGSPCGHPLRDLVLVNDRGAKVTQCRACLTSPAAQKALLARVEAEAKMRKAAGALAGEATADAVVRLAEDKSATEGAARSTQEGAIRHGRRWKDAERDKSTALAIISAVHGADVLPSRLTPERIEAALKRGAEGCEDLRESLRGVFGE